MLGLGSGLAEGKGRAGSAHNKGKLSKRLCLIIRGWVLHDYCGTLVVICALIRAGLCSSNADSIEESALQHHIHTASYFLIVKARWSVRVDLPKRCCPEVGLFDGLTVTRDTTPEGGPGAPPPSEAQNHVRKKGRNRKRPQRRTVLESKRSMQSLAACT